MPISEPSLAPLTVAGSGAGWPRVWAMWFTEVWRALQGWRRTLYGTLTHDFGSINAQTQATQTVTITGASVGDVVVVRPTAAVNGIILDGTVTAVNTVTVRAVNYSSGGIDPAEQVYKILVFQQ